jgi:hypothetical protein
VVRWKFSNFDFISDPPTMTIECTISKRRTHDTIILNRDYADLMKRWLAHRVADRKIWGNTKWYAKGALILRADLLESGIASERDDGSVIDLHSFRCYRVTKALLSGRSSRTVMESVRLSSESLLHRYTKLPQAAVVDLVDAVPLPKLPLRVVG